MLGHGAVSELPVSTISDGAAPAAPTEFESSSLSRLPRTYRAPRAAIGYLWTSATDGPAAPPPATEFENSTPSRLPRSYRAPRAALGYLWHTAQDADPFDVTSSRSRPTSRQYQAPRAALQALNSQAGTDGVDGGDASVVTRPRPHFYHLPPAATRILNGGDVQDTVAAPAEPTPSSSIPGQRYRPYTLPRGLRGMARFGAPQDVNGPVQPPDQSWQGIAPGSQLGLRRSALRRAQRLRGVRWHARFPEFSRKKLLETGVVSSPQIDRTKASSPWEEEGVVSSPQIETRTVVD